MRYDMENTDETLTIFFNKKKKNPNHFGERESEKNRENSEISNLGIWERE